MAPALPQKYPIKTVPTVGDLAPALPLSLVPCGTGSSIKYVRIREGKGVPQKAYESVWGSISKSMYAKYTSFTEFCPERQYFIYIVFKNDFSKFACLG